MPELKYNPERTSKELLKEIDKCDWQEMYELLSKNMT